ncbi:MAG: transferrin-binding protein-like solute binding protein [Hyphomicrobiaceae bacterium]
MSDGKQGKWASTLIAIGTTLALAACGGGGGGGSSAGLPPPPVIGSSATATAPSRSGKALMVYIPNGSKVSVTDTSAASGTGIVVNQSFTSGVGGTASTTASASFATPLTGGTTVLGTGVADRMTSAAATDPVQGYTTPNGANPGGLIMASRIANASGTAILQDTTYGVAAVLPGSGTMAIGGFHAGNLTPVGPLPVTATYNGQFGGYAMENGSSIAGVGPTFIHGDSNLTADFGSGTVNGTVSKIQGGNIVSTTQPYGLSFNGNIAGNTYTGTAAFTNPTGAAPPAPTSSALNGAFYGANAAETGGAIRIDGLAPTGAGTTSSTVVVGSFGAKK